MKKILCLVLSMIMCMTMFSACGTNKETETKSAAKTKFVLGLDDSFPPMGYRDENNNIVGFDIDVAKAVCEKLNFELELKPISWEAKEQELNTGSIDCIWNGLSINDKRKQEMELSNPYMKNNQVAVVLADSKANVMDDLKGKKVVIQNGSTASDAVEENKSFADSVGELVRVDNNVTAMMELTTKTTDAVVMDEVVARYYMDKKENQGKYKLLEGSLLEEEYAIAFKKGNTDLCNKVNDALKQLATEGKLKEICEKWMGSDITTIEK